jgi:microsomal dipeptidase-like Zn-dependent dipeptidase
MGWKELHEETTVVDLHTHPAMKSLLFHRGIGGGKRRFLSKLFEGAFWPFSERITFPKLEKGGVNVMLSTAYVLEREWVNDIKLIKWLFRAFPGVRKRVIDPTYFRATDDMLDEMEVEIAGYNSRRPDDAKNVVLAKSPAEMDAAIAAGYTAIVHSIEGAHSLQHVDAGKSSHVEDGAAWHASKRELLKNLEHFYDRGVAYLTLAHFYPNQVVSPVFPYPEYGLKQMNWKEALGRWDMNKGLTKVGVEVVEKMLDLGMLIDISHCTPTAKKQVFDIVDHHRKDSCVLATHTGAYGVNPDMYNLADHEIKWLADHNCAAGVIFMNYWISPVDSKMGLKYIDQTLRYMIDVGGEDVVGLGTDFDGFTDPPDEITNISELPRFTKYMLATNYYSDELMKKILGGNALRTLRKGWGG